MNDHLDSVDEGLRTEIASIGTPFDTDDIAQMVDKIKSWKFCQPMIDFVKFLKWDYPNAEFWLGYMVMVSNYLITPGPNVIGHGTDVWSHSFPDATM